MGTDRLRKPREKKNKIVSNNLPEMGHESSPPPLFFWTRNFGMVCLGFFFSVGLTPFDSQENPLAPEYRGITAERQELVSPEECRVPGAVGRIARAVQRGEIYFSKSGIAESIDWLHTSSSTKGRRSYGIGLPSLLTSPPSSYGLWVNI